MDRVLCLAFCLVVIAFAIFTLGYCAGSSADEITEPDEQPSTTESTVEATIPRATVPEPIVETTEATEPPTEPTEEPTIATEPPYTADELEMLAIVIYQEAGSDSCSDETRMMVGTVVMNRVADPRFPNTIYDVLTQKSQYGRFHWTGIVWPERADYESESHAVVRAYECAERILLGERALPSDVIWQAEFKQGTEVVAYQDGTYFCR